MSISRIEFAQLGRNTRILKIGSTEKVEYLMNTDVLSVKIGCFCRNIFRNYRFSKIEKDPKQGGMTENESPEKFV